MAAGVNLAPEQCHKCGAWDGGVVDSRPTDYGRRRRRVCGICGARWTTLEVRSDAQAAFNAHQAIMQAIVLVNEAWTHLEQARDLLAGEIPVVDDADE